MFEVPGRIVRSISRRLPDPPGDRLVLITFTFGDDPPAREGTAVEEPLIVCHAGRDTAIAFGSALEAFGAGFV